MHPQGVQKNTSYSGGIVMARKLIITIAPSSNFHGKEANPTLPEQPHEIASDAYECYNAGASIVHFHARDKQGIPTNDGMVLCDVINEIRSKCPQIIIQPSIAPAMRKDYKTTADDGLASLDVLVAQGCVTEMCSFDCGVSVVKSMNPEWGPVNIIMWHREWLDMAIKKIIDMGFKPELEIASIVELENTLDYIIKPGVLKNPSYTILMGMRANQCATSWSVDNLLHEVRRLPHGSVFGVMGVGPAQHPATIMSIILGGHVRVGFEDNIYFRKGELAKNNAQFVERIAKIAMDLGCEIATPDEAREILGLEKK